MKTNKLTSWSLPLLCLMLANAASFADDTDTPKTAGQTEHGSGITATEGMPGRYNKASGIIGMEVRNQDGERLGTIKDVVFDLKTERVSYAVVSAPPKNLIGMNEKLLAVPINALAISPDEKHLVLNADKSKIEAATGFDSRNWPSVGNPSWGAEPAWPKSNEKPAASPEKPDRNPTPMP